MTKPTRSGWRVPKLLLVGLLVLLIPTGANAQTAETTVVVPTGQLAAGLYPPAQWEAGAHIRLVNEASGANLSLGGLWLNVNEPTDNILHQLEEMWSAGATPFVNIHVDWAPAQVMAGVADSDITNFGAAVRRWLSRGEGRSVLLAPMPEMNGDWVPYGLDPVNFKRAYRYFVTMAAQDTTTDKVRWVFAPNGWSTAPHHMADYYPGADIVDFVGFSAYNWGSGQTGFQWTSAPATMCAPLNEAREFAREKPFLIAQTASATTGGDRGTWIADMFDFLTDDPNVVGFLYFDIDKEQDWAIYENGAMPAQWQQAMQSPATSYQFPISAWFTPGQLVVDTVNEVYPGCFGDIQRSQFQTEIEWLIASGITVGCGEARFCPTRAVTRAQMASFLARALNLPPAANDYFADDSGSLHQSDINSVAEAAITGGCGTSSYCPGEPTTRAQMATFLRRGLALGPSSSDFFTDDVGTIHEPDINSVAFTGITRGCSPTLFCPDSTVTREQMAAFLYRTFASSIGG